jgi:hypothetical protein
MGTRSNGESLQESWAGSSGDCIGSLREVAEPRANQKRYIRDWVLLPDALKLAQAIAGITEDEAKIDLCLALGDGKIMIQSRIGGTTLSEGETIKGRFAPGQEVRPDYFDWQKSRPVDRSFKFGSSENRQIEWTKLATADIIKAFSAEERVPLEAPKQSSSNPKSAARAVRQHLETHPNATMDSVRAATRGRFERSVIDDAYRIQRRQMTGSVVKRGPRPKTGPTNSAKK